MPPSMQSSWSNCSHRPALFWGSVFNPLPLLARCQPYSMEKGSTAEKKTWTRGTYAHLGSWSQEVLASLPSLPTAPPPSTGSEDPHPPLSRQAVHQELPPHSCHIHTHRDRAPPYTHLYGEPRRRTALSFILVLTNLRNYKGHHSLRLEFPLLWLLMKVSIHFPSLLPPGLGLFCFSVLCLSCHLPPSSYLSPQPPMPTN